MATRRPSTMFDVLHQSNMLHKIEKPAEEEKYAAFTKESYQHILQEAASVHDFNEEYDMQLIDGELVVTAPPAVLPPDPAKAGGCVFVDSAENPFPPELIGKAVEEIDKNITHPTFVVIAKRLKTKYIYRFSATKAFFIFTPWNPIRRFAVYIATNQFFDYLVILTILINCVFLAMTDPPESSEYVFLGIYTLEMLIKLLARGFFLTKYTYLRDPWNWLDFLVIITAYISIILQKTSSQKDLGNLTGLRTFRVLRALKTVSIIPGLKTIVNALLRAFRMLFEVITLTLFCLMVFALFGLQVFMGSLRQKCIREVPAYNSTDTLDYAMYYQQFLKNSSNWYELDGRYLLCGNSTGAGKCPPNYVCHPNQGDNPNFGYSSFDNFGWAMLSCFQLITLDFWEDLYNKVLRASGPWNIAFFILIVFFGSFYLINLMLAVVAMSYEEEAEVAGKESDRQKALSKKPPSIYDLSKVTLKARKFASNAREASKERVARDSREGCEPQTSGHHLMLPGSQPGVARPVVLERQHNLNMTDTSRNHNTNSNVATSNVAISNVATSNVATSNVATSNVATSNVAISNVAISNVNADVKITFGQPIQTVNPSKPLTKNQSKDSGYSTRSLSNSQTGGDTADGHNQNGNSRGTVQPMQNNNEIGCSDNIRPIVTNAIKPSASRQHPPRDNRVANQVVIITALDDNTPNSKLPNCLIDRNCPCCKNCCCNFKMWLRLQNKVFSVVSNLAFEMFIMCCIIFNTAIMASEHHDMSTSWKAVLRISNYIFTSIFTAEAILKIFASSKMYFKNGWNIFDLIVVIASLIDLGAENVDGLSVFRTFRLLRVIKLAQSWPTMRLLLTIIINTLGALANLTLILIIVIYIFAIIGMQLFRNSYTADKFDDGEIPRWNFSDFKHSFMMVFRVLCGEWIEPLWDCMRASGEICMVVFLPTLVFGNFMVLNLFLAMLLNSFASDSLRKDDVEVSKFMQAWTKIKAGCFKMFCCCFASWRKKKQKALQAASSQSNCINNVGVEQNAVEMSQVNKDCKIVLPIPDGQPTQYTELNVPTNNRNVVVESGSGEIQISPSASVADMSQGADNEDRVEECFPQACTVRLCKWYDPESVASKRWHSFRNFMCKVVDHKVFEGFVLLIITASSITLAFEDVYLVTQEGVDNILRVSNLIFAILFTLEMLLKWIAYGFKKYFTSFWTILDFFIVVISITTLLAEQLKFDDLSAFRSLRTLRALRPLRAISRWQGMRIVVNALLLAIPSIFNVLLVCIVFWLIFSIMGVQFFNGRFAKCVDANNERINASIVPNRTVCEKMKHLNYSWVNSKINFDNTLKGYLALFQVATFEGWIEVMVDAIDSVDIDMQPIPENSFGYYLYFIAFIVFGSFFTLNLFIGVIIDNFNMLKKKYEGSYLDAFLTANQKTYYNTLKKLSNKKPQKTIKRPKNKVQSCMYDLSLSNNFELIIVVIIFLNMIALAIEHYKQTSQYTDALEILNIVFTTIFTLEMIIKILGLRWHYFRLPWNVFDFTVVVLSILGVVLADMLHNVLITPTFLRVIRVFRIGRVLRLIKAAKGIRKLLFALIISLPALINIGALLFLVMYIYAIIGMSSFGRLKISGILDDMVNFQTFGNSITLLFRLMTSAGWNDVLHPMMISPPDCNATHWTTPDGIVLPDSNGDCGTVWLSVLYMVSYIIIVFLIVINMYIAVILENFSQAHEQEEVGITDDDFDMFYTVWERYDGMATQFISYPQLSDFISDLEPPLGVPKPNEIAIVNFNIPIVSCDKLHCLDILKALVKNVLGDVDETKEFREMQKQMDRKFEQTFPTRVKTVVESSTLERKRREVAARTIQRTWRYYAVHTNLNGVSTIAADRQNSALNKPNMSSRLNVALSSFFGSKTRPGSSLSVRSALSRSSFSTGSNVKPWSTTSMPLPEPNTGKPSKPMEL